MIANEILDSAQLPLWKWVVYICLLSVAIFSAVKAVRLIFGKREVSFFSKEHVQASLGALFFPSVFGLMFTMFGGIVAFTDGVSTEVVGKQIRQEYSLQGVKTDQFFPVSLEYTAWDTGGGEVDVHISDGRISMTDEYGESVAPREYKRLTREEIAEYVKEHTTLEDIEVFYEQTRSEQRNHDSPDEQFPSLHDLGNPELEKKFGVRGTHQGKPITLRVVRDGETFGVDFLEDSAVGLQEDDILPED